MIRAAFSLAGVVMAAEVTAATADAYPDSFADYLNRHGLYFEYLSLAEDSFWFETPAGDIVLRIHSAVAPSIAFVAAEGQPSDADVGRIRSDVELALSTTFDRLGVHRCENGATGDLAACIPLTVQIGFSVEHDDVVDLPDLRAFNGRRITGMTGRHNGAACGTYIETSRGEVSHLDAAFTSEMADTPSVFLPPTTSEMEKCLLGLLGVSVPQGLPSGDIDYYVARSLETMHKAESYLTRDQTAQDIPELVMTHALRKALGKEPTIGQ